MDCVTPTIPGINISKGEKIMKNKTNKITLRLDNDEYTHLLNNCKYSNMTISQYIRSLIMENVIADNRNNAEIMKLICNIHILIQDMGVENTEIEKEIRNLCQML